MNTSLLFATTLATCALGLTPAFALDPDPALTGTVHMMLPNVTTVRFIQQDGPKFLAAMAKYAPNLKVELVNAEGSAAKQQQQVEAAITAGTKAIVLVAADPSVASGILTEAKSANIPVIAYEHEAKDGPLDYFVQFGALKVGQAQGKYAAEALAKSGAKKVARLYGNKGDFYTTAVKQGQDEFLDPLIKDGKIEIVCEDYTDGWVPSAAQKLMEQCLTKTSDKVDAIVASNDGTASGAIAALTSQDMAGKVAVYGGQDANVEALQYILLGKQSATVLKPYGNLADAAAQVVVSVLEGKTPPDTIINGSFDNGFMKVPTGYLDVMNIDKSNVGAVVDAGVWKWSDICTGDAAAVPECKQ
jgi:D-xylose transport system substrate-binding protein